MKIIKSIICLFKGHVINTFESLVKDYMHDSRNWLCECHRCGLYEMHDGATSGLSVTLTKREAYKKRDEFITEVIMLHNLLEKIRRKSIESSENSE